MRTGLRLALDGDAVVTATWVTRSGPAPIDQTVVARTSKALGSAVQRVAVVDGKVRAIAIGGSGEIALSRLRQPKLLVVPRTGGAERVVAMLGELPTRPGNGYTGVAIANGELVFGVDNGYQTFDDEDGGIVWNPSLYRVPLGGGKPHDVSDTLGVDDLVVDGSDAYAIFCVVAIDYPTNAGIVRIPLGGGASKVLAEQQVVEGRCPSGLAVDEHDVYYALRDDLRRVPKDGGKAESIAKIAGASAVALDASFAYVAGAQEIVAVDKTGLAARTLAQTENAVSIAVDEVHAYWLLEREGYVRRVEKPRPQ